MKLLLNLCIAIIATTFGTTAQTFVVDAAQFQRYADANAATPPRQKGEKRVVFIGNSITENWQTTHPEFFSANRYICRGIGGQTSYTILLRFRADALNLDPTTIVLGIGANDIATGDSHYDEDRTFANIVTMAELARAHGVNIVLTTLLPAATYAWNPAATAVPDKIENLNRRLRAYATANSIPFADYYTPLVHPGDRALPVTFSDDGVHPNASGYTIMEPVIQAILKKL
ncbi:MAG: acylneuraminate cytidylyltransferase [Muribaculaceae bacterium]|nr:acylneuraminate cytidylyltransferase [Muribaculaceae bacterium]